MKYNNKTITKRKDRRNEWVLRFRKNNKQYAVYGHTQKETIKKYKLKLKELAEPKQQKIKEYTLKEWYKEFNQLYKKDKIKDTTQSKNDCTFKHIKPLHNYKLKDITILQVQKLLSDIEHKTVKKNIYILLNSLYEKAYINELVSKNIMKQVDKPKYKAKEKKALTKEQQKKFVTVCNAETYGTFYLICLFQGLRRGECKALKVNDIDLINNTLTIDESINEATTRTNTKNSQSNRVMPIFEQTKEILKTLIKGKNKNDFLFPDKLSRIVDNLNSISEKVKTHITPTILRHTFITRCQENNIPLFVVQSWVGHERGSVVTTKVYTHLNKETNEKYTNIMNLLAKNN